MKTSLFASLCFSSLVAGLSAATPPGTPPAASPGATRSAPGYAYRPIDVGTGPRPLKILILGGTGFIGPYEVKYALARGHQVTVFNRGKTHAGELPEGVEQLVGDRSTGDVAALKGRKWDVVIDNPTMLPKWVHDAAEVLQGNVERYIFISTISVYGEVAQPGADETAPTEKYTGADPMKENRETVVASHFALYGPLKALSEKEAEKFFPGKTMVIRPGLIVGPGDETDRFTYWPVRIARGGEVLAAGHPTDPVEIIDARDLAEWTIRMAEQETTGVFNAVGPAEGLTIGGMLDGIKAAFDAKSAKFTWVPADFLEKEKVSPWSDMPVWVPPSGENAGMGSISNRRAVAQGLTFRPLSTTARDTLAWFKAQPPARQATLKAGLTKEREAEVLKDWSKQAKESSRD